MPTKDILCTIGGILLILIPVDIVFSAVYFFFRDLAWLPVMWSIHIISIILIIIVERNID